MDRGKKVAWQRDTNDNSQQTVVTTSFLCTCIYKKRDTLKRRDTYLRLVIRAIVYFIRLPQTSEHHLGGVVLQSG